MKTNSSRLFRKSVVAMTSLLILAGCSSSTASGSTSQASSSAESQVSVIATVTEIDSDNIIIEPVEGSDELKSSDKFSLTSVDVEMPADLDVGSKIEIFYSGEIQEIYPAVLVGVERIENAE